MNAEQNPSICKRCPVCKETKPLSDFAKSKRRGVHWRCRACDAAYHRKRRTNPALVLKLRDYARQWYAENKEVAKASKRRILYGLSHEEYIALLTYQDGRCANPGCRTDKPGGKGT